MNRIYVYLNCKHTIRRKIEPLTTNSSIANINLGEFELKDIDGDRDKGGELMSCRYDRYNEGCFELYGRQYWLVEPKDFKELLQAYEVRELIQRELNGLMDDEDSSSWEMLMQKQEDYIQEFIDKRPDFDNGTLMRNLSFLLKKYNMKMGDLEKILGISAGYISRTAKENSAKKLSIDVVWKIAALFEISIDKLINDDISELTGNMGMLVNFMDRLLHQTECVDIEWENLGGIHGETDETFDQLGLFMREDDGFVRYLAPTRNREIRYWLADDIIITHSVDVSKQLVIIPFRMESKVKIHYDFMFVWAREDSGRYAKEKVFYSGDDPSGILDHHAEALYKEAKEHFMDVPVKADIREFISGYLEMEGDQK